MWRLKWRLYVGKINYGCWNAYTPPDVNCSSLWNSLNRGGELQFEFTHKEKKKVRECWRQVNVREGKEGERKKKREVTVS